MTIVAEILGVLLAFLIGGLSALMIVITGVNKKGK